VPPLPLPPPSYQSLTRDADGYWLGVQELDRGKQQESKQASSEWLAGVVGICSLCGYTTPSGAEPQRPMAYL
jgi:hypothetical protein